MVSFDLSEAHSWDIVPFAGSKPGEDEERRREHIRRINNGYWLCHRAFSSKARVVYGVAYEIPDSIGHVDVAIYGSILLHLRDPFLALQNGARLAQEAIIVTCRPPWRGLGAFLKSPRFHPSHHRPFQSDTWWALPPRLVQEYLAILGFVNSTVRWHRQSFLGKPRLLYTVVARR